MKTYDVGTYEIVRAELIVNVVLVSLATIAVILRFVARRVRKIKLWWDDWTILVCMFLVYALFGIQIADAIYGMRIHITVLPMENLVVLLKMLVAYQLIYGTTLVFAKFSYLFFYLRIFVNAGFIKSTYITMGIILAWWTANVLQVFLICTPFSSNWNVSIEYTCGNRPAAYTIIGAINMITDLIIWILPIQTVYKLHLPPSSKIGLCAIFAIGIVICAISIIRMNSLSKLNFSDISYDMINPVFWTVTEPSLAVINACLPTLRHLFGWFFPKLRDMTGSNKSSGRSKPSSNTFELMQDGEYPLTRVQDGETTIKITASARDDLESLGAGSDEQRGARREHSADSLTPGINVKKQWTVMG